MPDYLKKFQEPDYYDHEIVTNDDKRSKIGTLRVKPVSILWKPKGAQRFRAASLEEFQTWMEAKRQVKQ